MRTSPDASVSGGNSRRKCRTVRGRVLMKGRDAVRRLGDGAAARIREHAREVMGFPHDGGETRFARGRRPPRRRWRTRPGPEDLEACRVERGERSCSQRGPRPAARAGRGGRRIRSNHDEVSLVVDSRTALPVRPPRSTRALRRLPDPEICLRGEACSDRRLASALAGGTRGSTRAVVPLAGHRAPRGRPGCQRRSSRFPCLRPPRAPRPGR